VESRGFADCATQGLTPPIVALRPSLITRVVSGISIPRIAPALIRIIRGTILRHSWLLVWLLVALPTIIIVILPPLRLPRVIVIILPALLLPPVVIVVVPSVVCPSTVITTLIPLVLIGVVVSILPALILPPLILLVLRPLIRLILWVLPPLILPAIIIVTIVVIIVSRGVSTGLLPRLCGRWWY